jgi:HD-GYP domain-containing protein (c-di-GMP phosphodiesterase class II)
MSKRRYIPFRISTLRPGDVVNFDIYVMVGNRHLHYIRASDPFDAPRLSAFKTKGVKKLFFLEEAEQSYLDYLDAGLNQLSDSNLAKSEKVALISGAMTTEAENVSRNIETEKGYKKTEVRVEKVVNFLASESGALKELFASGEFSTDNHQHSANVANLSIGLAMKAGLNGTRDLLELGLASLIHDLGLTKLGFAADVQPETLSKEDKLRYFDHPKVSTEALADKPYITQAVVDLVFRHEEVGEGAGYPSKDRMSKLPMTSQILNLCNAYDRYCMLKKVSPLEASKTFFTDKVGLFPLDLFKMLTTILK